MKRFFLLLMALVMTASVASANSWGARGWTINAFDGGLWKDYTCLTDSYSSKRDFAQVVATSRYHNELICMQRVNKKTKVITSSTTAVHQPDYQGARKVKLSQFDGGFVISYPGEMFRFALISGEYILTDAQLVDNTVVTRLGDGRYRFVLGNEDAVWDAQNIALDRFNISCFPGIGQVEHLNRLYASLGEGNPFWGFPAEVLKSGTAAVYSAPDKKSWRASNGKASVSLKYPEHITVRGSVDGWDLIEYKVSRRTSRIGYIQSGYVAKAGPLELLSIPGYVIRHTYITDDPFVSQYAQKNLIPGEKLTVLGYVNEFYAYVDYGNMRGFVPLTAIDLEMDPRVEAAMNANLPEVQARMVGKWELWAGGNMISGDENSFAPDGRFESAVFDERGLVESRRGRYYVAPYDPASGVSWANPAYLLTMVYDDGQVTQRGMDLMTAEEAGAEPFDDVGDLVLSLTNEEGGGGYVLVNR